MYACGFTLSVPTLSALADPNSATFASLTWACSAWPSVDPIAAIVWVILPSLPFMVNFINPLVADLSSLASFFNAKSAFL